MADKIAVMNHGVIEQLGTPARDLRQTGKPVRRRLHRLAADEFSQLSRSPREGRREASILTTARSAYPTVRENLGEGEFVLGVRPEQVQFTDAGPLRGVVFGVEYLGTTQIVTLTTPHGTLRARVSADAQSARRRTHRSRL